MKSIDLDKTLKAVEKRLIVRALADSNGVKAWAAQALGIKRTTLLAKMAQHKIKVVIKEEENHGDDSN